MGGVGDAPWDCNHCRANLRGGAFRFLNMNQQEPGSHGPGTCGREGAGKLDARRVRHIAVLVDCVGRESITTLTCSEGMEVEPHLACGMPPTSMHRRGIVAHARLEHVAVVDHGERTGFHLKTLRPCATARFDTLSTGNRVVPISRTASLGENFALPQGVST